MLAFALACVLLLGAVACETSTSSSLIPTTGILVRAESLTSGRGCGRNPTNLFKYAIVVYGYTQGPEDLPASYATPITGNVFDCFTDGTFIDLASVAGNSSFRLEVFAYNEVGFVASRTEIENAGSNATVLRNTSPTWTTECTATQQPQVEALALCEPLLAGLAGIGGTTPPTRISMPTSTFHLPSGRAATCVTAAPDAGVGADAGEAGVGLAEAGTPDAALDGGDAATDAAAAAEPPILFTTARVRYRIGGMLIGPTVDVPCPSAYLADVPAEPARYDLDIGLLDSNGAPLGETGCSVTTQTGATSSAVCP